MGLAGIAACGDVGSSGPGFPIDAHSGDFSVIWGGQDRGVSDELVYLQDVFPTILEMAGADVPDNDFASLLPLLGPPATAAGERRPGLLGALRGRAGWLGGMGSWHRREEVFGEFDQQITTTIQRVIRTREHKLVISAADLRVGASN